MESLNEAKTDYNTGDLMEKAWYESKTMWGAIRTFVVGGLTVTGYV